MHRQLESKYNLKEKLQGIKQQKKELSDIVSNQLSAALLSYGLLFPVI